MHCGSNDWFPANPFAQALAFKIIHSKYSSCIIIGESPAKGLLSSNTQNSVNINPDMSAGNLEVKEYDRDDSKKPFLGSGRASEARWKRRSLGASAPSM